MNKDQYCASQPLRGKNWTDDETKVFIKVIEKYFSKLQGRGRKGKVFAQIASHLRDLHGILRTPKEIQNKFKSMMREYRSALASYVEAKDCSPCNYKWFADLHTFMRHTDSSYIDPTTCIGEENWGSSIPVAVRGKEFVKATDKSESSTITLPVSNNDELPQSHSQLSVMPEQQGSNQNGTSRSAEFLNTKELQPDDTALSNSAENQSTKKMRFSSKDDEDYGINTSQCAWRLINDDLNEHKKVSTQIQEKICDSLENFNQMIQNLNGALSIIPNLFSQLLQCQAHQLSQFSQQNRHPASVILTPLPQLGNQQLDQSTSAQYMLLYDPSAHIQGSKAALPDP